MLIRPPQPKRWCAVARRVAVAFPVALLAPASLAQQPASAPVSGLTPGPDHHQLDGNGHPNPHVQRGHADPRGLAGHNAHAAEREQQALHDQIQEKFKSFNAAMKKATVDRQLEQRRQFAIRQLRDRQDAAVDPRTGSAVTKDIAGRDVRSARNQRPAPTPMPVSVRNASTDAPRSPPAWRPNLTVLGGAAKYDPKKAAVLDGVALHHRL